MTDLTKTTNEQGLEEFNKLKASIDDQVSNLLAIKVIDETSMAVANQQLSKAKQLDKDIDSRHALVKEEALRFCQAADLAKRTLKAPLAPATAHVEAEILVFVKAEAIRKQKEVAELEAKQAELIAEAEQSKQALIIQMQEFEARAFNLINDATTPAELSFVYTNYVLAFPAVYDAQIKERVMKLGKAKLTFLQTMSSGGNATEYNNLYNEYTGTAKQEIVAPVIAMPSFDNKVIEEKIAILENSSAPTNIKKVWNFEVASMEAIPLAWLSVDEAKVKAYIKENSDKLVDGNVVCGIKFFQESKVKVK